MRTRLNSHIKQSAPGIWAAAALLFLFIVYAPLELYFTNQREFWYDLYDMLPVILVCFTGCLAVAACLCILAECLHTRLYQMLTLVFFLVFAASYVQGTFLISNLPGFTGEPIDWSAYSMEDVKTAAVWCMLAAVLFVIPVFVKLERLCRWIQTVSMGMCLMLLVTLICLCVSTKGYEKADNLMVTVKNEYEYSTDKNFVILLLDTVDAEAFSAVLEDKPEYKELFTDFTYYPNTMSVYPVTMTSVPQILTGKLFQFETSYKKYLRSAIKDSVLFGMLEEQSYQMGIYDDEIPFDKADNLGRFDNMLDKLYEIRSHQDFAKVILKMGGIKYTPYSVKYYCYDLPDKVKQLKVIREGCDYKLAQSDNDIFYWGIHSNAITYTGEKCFKFIYLEGAHPPFNYTPQAQVLPDGQEGTYYDSVEASIFITGAYLQKLKDNGCYDNTAVMIMADHGYDYNNDTSSDGLIGARQNPILLVKGFEEHHPMAESSAPLSFLDLEEGYKALLEGKTGGDVFTVKEGEDRVRRFLFMGSDTDAYIQEYIQTKGARDMDTLIPSDVRYYRK